MRGRAWALRRSVGVYTRLGSRAGGRTLWRRSAMTRRSSPERRSSTMRRSSPLRRSTATSTTCCRRSLLRRRSSARRSLPLRRPAPIRPPSQNLSRRSPRTRHLRKTYAFGWLPLGCASSLGFRHLPPRSSITHRLRHGHPATGDVTERHAAGPTAVRFVQHESLLLQSRGAQRRDILQRVRTQAETWRQLRGMGETFTGYSASPCGFSTTHLVC